MRGRMHDTDALPAAIGPARARAARRRPPPSLPTRTASLPMPTPAAVPDTRIEAAARHCFDAHRTRSRYAPLDAELRAGPLEDAYRIQDALHRIMTAGGRGHVAGWKIALTSAAMQRMTGVDQPAAGAIFSSVVHASPARRSVAGHHHLGVEFEVAVRIGADLAAGGAPWTRETVAGHVEACMPAFELVEDGNADYATLDAFSLIAQNTWNGGVVLGEPVVAWQGLDLERAATRCWIDDRPAGEGRAGDALGHPLEAVAWLANLLNRRGRHLAAGMVVMTGSSIVTQFPSAGQRVRFAIEGLGEVSLELEDRGAGR
jgi:2-keto-4-pentenoate hydratase